MTGGPAAGRVLSSIALVGVVALGPAATTFAQPMRTVAPPTVDPGALGAALALSGHPGPPDPTDFKYLCSQPTLVGDVPTDAPIGEKVLDLPDAWRFSTGAGVKVAVIDTGVTRSDRLPNVQPGGDFVSGSDGTDDCDGHGTLVAGIIAGQPSRDKSDGFSGIAPDAQILAIRQFSDHFVAKNSANNQSGEVTASGYGTTLTLAAAVIHAVDLGATVINISQVECVPAGTDMADGALGAAIDYAYQRNVVVVVAAGNLGDSDKCKDQNGNGWDQVRTTASPAWFPHVLAVGSVEADGAPSPFTLYGPWVGVAAVGNPVMSLNQAGGPANARAVAQGQGPYYGTSFATPFVAGLAALVRSRFPDWDAQRVIDQITRTAHAPGPGRDDRVGAGLIDPLAALTAQLPAQPVTSGVGRPQAFPVSPPPGRPGHRARLVAAVGTGACLAVLAVGWLVAIPFRRKRPGDELPEFDS